MTQPVLRDNVYMLLAQFERDIADLKRRLLDIADLTGLPSVPSGPAGGDLADAYPDPRVAALQGKPVSAPVAGDDDKVLVYDYGTDTMGWVTQSGGGGGSGSFNSSYKWGTD